LHEKNVRRLYQESKRLGVKMTVLLNVIVGEGLAALQDVDAGDIEFVETIGGSHPEQPPEEMAHANG
jgi:hypothetical protein